jgi:hypothetical protein
MDVGESDRKKEIFTIEFFYIDTYVRRMKERVRDTINKLFARYQNKGSPHSMIKKNEPRENHAKSSAHKDGTSQNDERDTSTMFRLA